jgi:uncharacterized protein YggT (Ycf19 family)
MMIYTTNVFAAPLIMVVWAIDVYVFMFSLRLLLSQLPSTLDSRFCRGLGLFTDPVVETVRRWLFKYRRKPVANWMPCLTVVLAGLIVRHLLIWVVVSVLC